MSSEVAVDDASSLIQSVVPFKIEVEKPVVSFTTSLFDILSYCSSIASQNDGVAADKRTDPTSNPLLGAQMNFTKALIGISKLKGREGLEDVAKQMAADFYAVHNISMMSQSADWFNNKNVKLSMGIVPNEMSLNLWQFSTLYEKAVKTLKTVPEGQFCGFQHSVYAFVEPFFDDITGPTIKKRISTLRGKSLPPLEGMFNHVASFLTGANQSDGMGTMMTTFRSLLRHPDSTDMINGLVMQAPNSFKTPIMGIVNDIRAGKEVSLLEVFGQVARSSFKELAEAGKDAKPEDLKSTSA